MSPIRPTPVVKLAVLAALLCSVAITVPGAQMRMGGNDRTYKNTGSVEAYLKALFPKVAHFTREKGNIPHFKIFGPDHAQNPNAQPIGVAWWTAELDPQEVGYHGPIKMIVGLDWNGVLAGAIVDFDTEPYGSFSVEPGEFGVQFKGKKLTDPFRVGRDVDAISRATITITSATRAIRDTSRMVARVLLPPGTYVKP